MSPAPRRAISSWRARPRILPRPLPIDTAGIPRNKTPPGDAQAIWGSPSPVPAGCGGADAPQAGRAADTALWTREFPPLLPPPLSAAFSSSPLQKIRQLQKLALVHKLEARTRINTPLPRRLSASPPIPAPAPPLPLSLPLCSRQRPPLRLRAGVSGGTGRDPVRREMMLEKVGQPRTEMGGAGIWRDDGKGVGDGR